MIGFNLFRLGWKGLPSISTLAYYEHSFFTTVIFMTLGQELNDINLFVLHSTYPSAVSLVTPIIQVGSQCYTQVLD
jgi:hypothetical protein